ncbi:DUF4876 domain-containing protein [Alistipes sp.]|uniref:DUF4876 domain-containing protein n=1 Tax=Alistipes sp. TaxID=1872444 RepID=UPI0025C59CB6|nr:DUF4876 domain-containing protein [Alistipes sp.]
MKRILYCLIPLAAAFLLCGCLKDLKDGELLHGNREVLISIDLGGELASLDKAGFRVTMRNTKIGNTYTAETDGRGEVRIDAEYGNYSVIVSKVADVGGVSKFLHATRDFVLNKDGQSVGTEHLEIRATARGAIILKEVYFHKTMSADESAKYNYDQYFTLCNNSDEVQYLDGVGVGFHTTFNSGKSVVYNKFWLGSTSTELRDSIPVNAFGFVFPGTGRDHPIRPGEEVVIALSAVEHTAAQTNRPMNLAAENVWAMYIDRFGSGAAVKAPAAGVERLECFCELASGNSIVLSISSPAIVVYRLPGDPYAYVREGAVKGRPYGQVMYQPAKYQSMPSIMVPKECILDGVEFRNNDTHVPRLCADISLQPLFITTTSYSGQSYIRRVDAAASAIVGRTVYQDTNNSADDWISLDEPTLCTEYKNR